LNYYKLLSGGNLWNYIKIKRRLKS
jgi:hypothetical protein